MGTMASRGGSHKFDAVRLLVGVIFFLTASCFFFIFGEEVTGHWVAGKYRKEDEATVEMYRRRMTNRALEHTMDSYSQKEAQRILSELREAQANKPPEDTKKDESETELSYQAAEKYKEHVVRQIEAANLTTGSWEAIADDVVIAVKTGSEVAKRRLDWANNSWLHGRRVPNLLFISDEENEELKLHGMKEQAKAYVKGRDGLNEEGLYPGTFPGGWKGDKDKNLPGFALMYDLHPGKKFYFMCDDDTYVLLDNLADALNNEQLLLDNAQRPFLAGNLFATPRHEKNCFDPRTKIKPSFAHGGSGILLNGLAARALRENIGMCVETFHTCWAGDVQVSLCVNYVTTMPKILKLDVFCQDPPLKLFKLEKIFGASEQKKNTPKNRWRSAKKPATFHKFLDANEYLSMARFDRVYNQTRTFNNIRNFFLEEGYPAARKV